jgi:hypothetical protein
MDRGRYKNFYSDTVLQKAAIIFHNLSEPNKNRKIALTETQSSYFSESSVRIELKVDWTRTLKFRSELTSHSVGRKFPMQYNRSCRAGGIQNGSGNLISRAPPRILCRRRLRGTSPTPAPRRPPGHLHSRARSSPSPISFPVFPHSAGAGTTSSLTAPSPPRCRRRTRK